MALVMSLFSSSVIGMCFLAIPSLNEIASQKYSFIFPFPPLFSPPASPTFNHTRSIAGLRCAMNGFANAWGWATEAT